MRSHTEHPTSFDIGLKLGEAAGGARWIVLALENASSELRTLRQEMREIRDEVHEHSLTLMSISERHRRMDCDRRKKKSDTPPPSFLAEVKEWLSIIAAASVIGSLIAGKIATGDALGLLVKLAGH